MGEDRKAKIVRQLRGGQITIPAEFRQQLGIQDDSLLQVTLERDELRVRKVALTETAGEAPWFKDLYDYFAPVREEVAASGVSEEELNADIDAAVRAVRQRRG